MRENAPRGPRGRAVNFAKAAHMVRETFESFCKFLSEECFGSTFYHSPSETLDLTYRVVRSNLD